MKLRWSKRSQLDLQRLADRIIADGKPMAATAFLTELRDTAALLAQNPLMGRSGRRHDTREWVAHKNYLITYRLHGDELQILQVWHVARERRA